MKRDMDLVRLIMLEIEKSDEDEIANIKIPDYEDDVVKSHCNLLKQNDMINKFNTDILGNYYVGQLTWKGSDYLDKVRDNTVWKKVKHFIKAQGLPLVLDTIINLSPTIISTIINS